VIDRIGPLASFVSASLAPDRFRTALLVAFATIGAGLVMVGLLGLTSQAVTERTREIALRLALGAEPGALWRRMTLDSLASVAIGLVAGECAAVFAVRMLGGVLVSVVSPSIMVYGVVVVALLGPCTIAAAIPAYGVMRVDPMSVLQSE
jgi:putative ABC transport system permease protein